MKLCWNNLEKVKLSFPNFRGQGREPQLAYYDGVGKWVEKKYLLDYVEGCNYCGEDFLKPVGQKTHYCDKECRHEATKISIFEKKARNYVKQSNNKKERSKNRKKPITMPKNRVMYKTIYKTLGKYKTFRIEPGQEKAAQMLCDNPECDNWFNITRNQYLHLRSVIYGKGDFVNGLTCVFCSTECKRHSRGYHKVDELIMADLWKAGHYKEVYAIKRELYNNIKPVELIINFKAATELSKRKRKPYIKPKRVYTDIIKFELNKKYIKNTKKIYARSHNRKYMVKYHSDEEYREVVKLNARIKYEERRKNKPEEIILKRLLYYTRVRAKEKEFEHNITYRWLKEQTKNACPKTGFEFKYNPYNIRDMYRPSVDRLDNSKGYTKDNCQVVIWAYNCAKASWTDEILYKVLKTLI